MAFRAGRAPAPPGAVSRVRPAVYDRGRTSAAGLRRYRCQVSGELKAPLTARLRRFWVALDYAAAAGCTLFIFVAFESRSRGGAVSGQLTTNGWPLALALALALSIPIAIRRRAPARALLLVLAACAVTLVLGGEITLGPFVPLAVVLYQAASTARRPIAVAGLAAALALLAVQATMAHFTGPGPGSTVGVGLSLTVVWVIGYAVQQRRTHLAHLRDRAASDAVTQERLRIARELHDVVAHSMTVVTVQAGFGEYVFDSQPGEARAALGAIQAVSREALGEMQRMLCVLRQQDAELSAAADQAGSRALDGAARGGSRLSPARLLRPAPAGEGQARAGANGASGTGESGPPPPPPATSAPLAPAPGLASLDRLVERTAGAGVTVTVERTGRVRALPTGLDLSAFRIVQEALTNVVKHSGADRCHVVLAYGASFLLVKVLDDGPAGRAARAAAPVPATTAPSAGARPRPAAGRVLASAEPRAGHGLIGMRERVSLCGGEFAAGARPEGGFLVRARLPLAGLSS